ncbi:MAG: IS110 family transposase [Pyrinomonadaceae bacterium]
MDYRVYCGVDFHARQQTVCSLTTEDGVMSTHELKHQNKAELKAFYAQFSGPVLVGLEASGYSPWFEQLLEELGHEVWLGDATEIRRRARRRQKNDRRDAELILDLLLHGEFPRIHRPSVTSREILRMLRYRHKLVQMRTIIKNSLQALSIQSGLSLRAKLFTRAGLAQLQSVTMSPMMQYQREQWLAALEPLNQRILEAVTWLEQKAAGDERVERLRTHPGIGLLTALGLVHTLEPIARFSNQRKVAAYVGFDPKERSSGEKKRYLGISKAGSRVLRFLLIEAAQTTCKGDPELKRFYLRLLHRHGKAKAKVAVARKLLIRSYILLRDRIDYAEFQRRAVAARLARQDA